MYLSFPLFRDMHSKEKEYLMNEIKRAANKNESESINNVYNNVSNVDNDLLLLKLLCVLSLKM